MITDRYLEISLRSDLSYYIKCKLKIEAPGLHHPRVDGGVEDLQVKLRPRDAHRAEEVRAAVQRIIETPYVVNRVFDLVGAYYLVVGVSVIPERTCRAHEDCRAHPKIGRACWEASHGRCGECLAPFPVHVSTCSHVVRPDGDPRHDPAPQASEPKDER